MMKGCFVLDVRPRDADAPDYYDVQLNIDRLMREFRGEPCLDRLCRKTGMTRGEVLRAFMPGATVDPATGKVSINAGYDPAFDEGVLEAMIWSLVSHEVGRALAGGLPRTRCPRARSNADGKCCGEDEPRRRIGRKECR